MNGLFRHGDKDFYQLFNYSSCCLLLSLLIVINTGSGQFFQLTTKISVKNGAYRHVLAKPNVDPSGVAILSWAGWVILIL